MIAEPFLGALIGLSCKAVYRAARQAYERWQGIRSEREILDQIGADLAALQSHLAGPEAELAGAAVLAARSLAGAAAAVTGAVASQPVASQALLVSHLVHGVLDRARTAIEAEGLDINGLELLDSATAEKLAAWGRGDSGIRWLSLKGLQSLDPATAETLAAWGRGERNSLHLRVRDAPNG